MTVGANAAVAVGDIAHFSLDEIPVTQLRINDSRSHVMGLIWGAGATGDLAGSSERLVLSFNRDDLVLEPDEALFLNSEDIVGTPPVNATVNAFYQD